MPAYHTHIIFSDVFFRHFKNDKNIIKEEIDYNSLRTYSLGIDLSELKVFPIDAHNQYTRLFFINLISLIKYYKLQDDKYVLALLYGHVLHYFLDVNLHPFIYYHEKGLDQVGILNNHTLFEGYLSQHFVNKYLNKNVNQIPASYFNKGNLDDDTLKKLIDETYSATYNCKKTSIIYKRTLQAFSTFENLIASIDLNRLKSIFGFNTLIEKYGLNNLDFTNLNNSLWYDPITNQMHYESVNELFDKALEDTFNAINIINNYLYNNGTLSSIEKIFNNISYDTAHDCNIPKNFKFIKKYIRKK